jgi:tetratricopeptide (TPR) repeat protein
VRAIPLTFLLVLCCLPILAAAAPSPADEVPSGAATNWILGHRLLRDGDIKGALPYLHLAYRADPDQPLIAMDFQRALAAEGYLADAIGVMNRLVEAHPDSASWRLRRSGLNIRSGNVDAALADLRELRRRGEINLEVVSTEAAIHMRQGRLGAALDAYRDALYLLPGRKADIYLGMVDVLQQGGETTRIPEVLDEALTAEPANPGLWLSYVRSMAVLGRHEEALAGAERADREVLPLRPDPADAEEDPAADLPYTPPLPRGHGQVPAADRWPAESFRVELADVYARTGDLERAVAVLETMEAGGTLGEQASLWLARMLIGTGRHEEAAVQIARITERWPESGRGRFLQGKLAESRDDWDGAITEYRAATAMDARDPEIGIALVRAMLVAWGPSLAGDAQRREDLHAAAMQASTRVDAGDSPSQLVLGYAFRAAADNERAAWRFGLAAEEAGLRLTALIQQSICYDDLGEASQARRVLERLRREFPENAEVANSLGYFLAEKDEDLDQAEVLVRQALAVEPNNGAYLDSMGWVYYRLGRYDDAFDYLVQAVNVLPEDPVILEHLGMTLAALGRAEEARAALERAIAAGGDRERLEAVAEGIGQEGP